MNLYSDSAIDRAIREADPLRSASVTRRRYARAEMIHLRDSAGPRQGLEPTAADLAVALRLRASDLLGLSPAAGFYLGPDER